MRCSLVADSDAGVAAPSRALPFISWITASRRPTVGSRSATAPIVGELAFAFTGAAATYPGAGRELLLAWPEIGDLLASTSFRPARCHMRCTPPAHDATVADATQRVRPGLPRARRIFPQGPGSDAERGHRTFFGRDQRIAGIRGLARSGRNVRRDRSLGTSRRAAHRRLSHCSGRNGVLPQQPASWQSGGSLHPKLRSRQRWPKNRELT